MMIIMRTNDHLSDDLYRISKLIYIGMYNRLNVRERGGDARGLLPSAPSLKNPNLTQPISHIRVGLEFIFVF